MDPSVYVVADRLMWQVPHMDWFSLNKLQRPHNKLQGLKICWISFKKTVQGLSYWNFIKYVMKGDGEIKKNTECLKLSLNISETTEGKSKVLVSTEKVP